MTYDELVRRLREQVECDKKLYPQGVPFETLLLDLAADAIEDLQAAVPRWIPVTERLPEPGVPCLCWCKSGTYGQIRWYGLYYLTSHRTWAIYDNDYENQEVTHWMYRPEPPKEEQDGA